ncbi:hypothetical protein BX070DRAFT_42837 [Coemansia spiralis]|nr:hypothetical protein BX070DRAFT_42837 [Coemansia spiralis]
MISGNDICMCVKMSSLRQKKEIAFVAVEDRWELIEENPESLCGNVDPMTRQLAIQYQSSTTNLKQTAATRIQGQCILFDRSDQMAENRKEKLVLYLKNRRGGIGWRREGEAVPIYKYQKCVFSFFLFWSRGWWHGCMLSIISSGTARNTLWLDAKWSLNRRESNETSPKQTHKQTQSYESAAVLGEAGEGSWKGPGHTDSWLVELLATTMLYSNVRCAKSIHTPSSLSTE